MSLSGFTLYMIKHSKHFCDLLRKYDIFGRTYLFNIDGYHLQQDDPSWELTYVVDAYHAGNVSSCPR